VQLRYYDSKGGRHSGGAFLTKTEALNHYRDLIEPELNGRPAARRDLTFSELVDVFLDRHGRIAKPRTIRTLRERLRRPLNDYGDVPLADLEHMTDELAGLASQLPERYRYSVMSALRQACEAGIRYGYMTRNPAKLAGSNPMPAPRAVRVYTRKNSRSSPTSSTVEERLRLPSQPRQDFGPRSGQTSSAATSTAHVACSQSEVRRRSAREERSR
jgi:hypothetical protein